MPGWIHSHQAAYDASQHKITVSGGLLHIAPDGEDADLVPNTDQFELNLADLKWCKVE